MSQGMQPPADTLCAAQALGLSFDPGDTDRLSAYLSLLAEANTRMSLTSVRDPAGMWEKHILDSLTLAPFVDALRREPAPDGSEARIADIGSGGGAPAIPLAIIFPTVRWTLIESTGKKADFLAFAADALGLSNVAVVPDRAETIGRAGAFRGVFDGVTARAVGRLAEILELASPLLRAGGLALCIKGERASKELAEAKRALHMLHMAQANDGAEPLRTPTGRIVVVEQLRPTPKQYPRRPGEPKRAPLGVPQSKV